MRLIEKVKAVMSKKLVLIDPHVFSSVQNGILLFSRHFIFSFTFLVHSDLSDVNFDKYHLQVAVNIYFHRQLFTVTKEITFHNVTYSSVLFLIQLLQLTRHYILVIASLS